MNSSKIKNKEEKILIILPGWGGSNKTWADFVTLSKQYFQDVIVIDLPCFGNEPCPTEVWGVKEYSIFVKRQISKLRNSKLILLGHSFGGAVATHLIATNPDLVERLILSGAAIYRPKNYIKRVVFGILAKIGKIFFKFIPSSKLQKYVIKILYKIINSHDFSNTSGIQRSIFNKVIREDQSHLLADISIPTLVIHGTCDKYVPFKFGIRIAKNIQFASFSAIKDGGHGLHLKWKQKFLDEILIFIKKTY